MFSFLQYILSSLSEFEHWKNILMIEVSLCRKKILGWKYWKNVHKSANAAIMKWKKERNLHNKVNVIHWLDKGSNDNILNERRRSNNVAWWDKKCNIKLVAKFNFSIYIQISSEKRYFVYLIFSHFLFKKSGKRRWKSY